MASKAFGIVTSTPRRVNVYGLQDYRPAGAFTFAGKFRVIDFPVSNFSNSGIKNIEVYLNKHPKALTDHLGTGRSYNLNSKRDRLQLFYCNHHMENEVYNTDISDYMDNLAHIKNLDQEYVIIAPCYMVYKQDYSALLNDHILSGADITMLYHRVNNAKDHFLNCRVVTMDQDQMILSLEINRGNRQNQCVFMDTYVMKKDLFVTLVERAAAYSSTYSLAQMLSVVLRSEEYQIRGQQHKGFFASIDDLKSYYESNMALLDLKQMRDLFSDDWWIHTRTTDSQPARIYEGADVKTSMIANGCHIEGTVKNSIIGRGVTIAKGAVVENSIVLDHANIGADVHLDCQIVDKYANITKTRDLIATPDKPGYVHRADKL